MAREIFLGFWNINRFLLGIFLHGSIVQLWELREFCLKLLSYDFIFKFKI